MTISIFRLEKRYFVQLIMLACMVLLSADAYSQTLPGRAERLALRANSKAAGFSQIFFAKNTFQRVLQGADRVRFFNGIGASSRSGVLMVIGLDANGNEIGNEFLQADVNNIPAMISREVKDQQVAAAEANSRITAFMSEYDVASLQEVLATPGATGVTFAPTTVTGTDGSQILTISVVPATSSISTMRLAPKAAPCPPECGDR